MQYVFILNISLYFLTTLFVTVIFISGFWLTDWSNCENNESIFYFFFKWWLQSLPTTADAPAIMNAQK